MSMRLCLATAIAVGCLPAIGQSQTAETRVDFSGVYGPPPFVGGGPPRIEPEVYPFTEQGRMASEAFNPADDPANDVDCILETMPPIVFSGNPMEITDEGEQIGRFRMRIMPDRVVPFRTEHSAALKKVAIRQ